MREIRRRNIRSALVASFVLAVLAVVIGILVDPGLFGRAVTIKDWFVHVASETLVEYSEHIVVARYQDETVHETPNSSLYPDAPTSFTDVYRRFEVVESLKGGFEPGDTIYVGWDVGHTIVNEETGEPEFRSREVPATSEDADYALFLNPSWSRSRHPDDRATSVWQTPQGLEVAVVDAQGRLSFQVDSYYRAALKDLGFKPVPGSGAPFELTTSGVRKLVASVSGGAE